MNAVMDSSTPRGRPGAALTNVLERIERHAPALDQGETNGRLDVMEAAWGHIAELEDLERKLAELAERVRQPQKLAELSSPDRAESLVAGLVEVAALGNKVYQLDVLLPLFLQHCSPEHRDYWSRNDGVIVGLIASGHGSTNEEIREALRQRGVLCWYVSTDKAFRLVRTDWLSDDEKIVEWVLGDHPGRPCRFCGIWEQEVTELQTVKRRIDKGGMTQKPDELVDHVHGPCLPYWHSWVARTAHVKGQKMKLLQEPQA